jgi:hypothetical protein
VAQPNRPVWAEISSQRLLANYEKLRGLAGSNADLMAVVKADAYGHDALACAPLLAAAGAQWLGVTSTEEGCAVRAVCPQPRILVMSGVFQGDAETVVDWGLTCWSRWEWPATCLPGRSRFIWRLIPGCRARAWAWLSWRRCYLVFTPIHACGWKEC